MKAHMEREYSITRFQFTKILIQIEVILNSRALSNDAPDLNPPNPTHFLLILL